MALLYGLGTYEEREDEALPGLSWRLMLGIGALPGILLLPFMTASRAAPPAASKMTLARALGMRRYWPKLIGCAGGWFLFDVTFYGNTLFAPTILKSVFHSHAGLTPTVGNTLEDNLSLQLTILAMIGLPGYYMSVYFMDILGRKNIQLQGFVCISLLYAALGIFLDDLKDDAFSLVVIYGLTYFFSNFGPNSTTFILPSETFPRDVRTSLNGFCAAAGKFGAALGSACFKPLADSYGASAAFYMCAACAALGFFLTIYFVEDSRGLGMEEGPEAPDERLEHDRENNAA
jgi:PHS family inorganic phosphate transporter-like MFS transporter